MRICVQVRKIGRVVQILQIGRYWLDTNVFTITLHYIASLRNVCISYTAMTTPSLCEQFQIAGDFNTDGIVT